MSMISTEDHNEVSAVFKAEIDRLKAENAELLAKNKQLQFQADVIDALNDVAYCNGYKFGAQEMSSKYRKEADESIDRRRDAAKEAIAKARGTP